MMLSRCAREYLAHFLFYVQNSLLKSCLRKFFLYVLMCVDGYLKKERSMVGDGRRTELLPHLTRSERKVLWGHHPKIVHLKDMKRSEKHFIRSGDDASGQPFVRIVDPHTKGCAGITSYLHGKTRGILARILKKGECLCQVQLARNIYVDGSRRLCLDYIIIDVPDTTVAHPIVVKKNTDLSGNDTEGMRSVQLVEDNLILLYGHP